MPQAKKHNSHAERQAAYRRRQEAAHKALLSSKGLAPLPAIATIPGWVRWKQMIDYSSSCIRSMHDEMQRYYNDRSEAWIEGDKGDAFLRCMEAVEELADYADECRSQFNEDGRRQKACASVNRQHALSDMRSRVVNTTE